MIRLTSAEMDNCTPTREQLENYLAEPDDKLATSLDLVEKRLIAKAILYGENIAHAQLKKVENYGSTKCPHASRGNLLRKDCLYCWQALLKEIE